MSNKYLVTLQGLPPRVTLAGWEAHSGAWTIPLLAVQTGDTLVLEPDIPADVSGRAEIVITLVTIDGSPLAEARTTLVIGPDTVAPATEKTVAAPEQNQPSDMLDANAQTASSPAPISGEVKMRAEKLLAQGEKYLAEANIEVARQFFRRAADVGLAAAALRLAATYDAAELARLQVQGVVPDPIEAHKWYERARILGASDAEVGAGLAEAKSVFPPFALLRPWMETSPTSTETPGREKPSAADHLMDPRKQERAQRLMEKGNEQLEGGNVSAARLFYEYAADAGLAEAAMALAATFDARELAKLNVRGTEPDAKEAQRWYELARQLGATEAEQHIRQLGAR